MPFVVESVSRFVRNLPDWLRVVLTSRREPKLPDRSDEVARPVGRAPSCRAAVLTGRGGRADDPAVPGTVVGAHRGGRATRRWLGRQSAAVGIGRAFASSADDRARAGFRGRRAGAGLRAARGAGERGTGGHRGAVRGGGRATGQPEPGPGADRSPGRRRAAAHRGGSRAVRDPSRYGRLVRAAFAGPGRAGRRSGESVTRSVDRAAHPCGALVRGRRRRDHGARSVAPGRSTERRAPTPRCEPRPPVRQRP